jgi:hypothetical protein
VLVWAVNAQCCSLLSSDSLAPVRCRARGHRLGVLWDLSPRPFRVGIRGPPPVAHIGALRSDVLDASSLPVIAFGAIIVRMFADARCFPGG